MTARATEAVGRSNDAADGAFLDIATNTLAVLIVVLATRLLSLEAAPTDQSIEPADSPPTLVFPVMTDQLFRPFTNVYLAAEDRIVLLDLGPAVSALQERGLRTGTVPQGDFELKVEPRVIRDINTFHFELTPDADYVRTSGIDVTPDTLPEIVAGLEHDFRERRVAPTFAVRTSGMDAFARLYPAVLERGIPIRWIPFDDNRPIAFSRSHGNLQHPSFYW
ncbi:MAG: hypothetical protein H6842_11105 [Rhodospirillaceae bacterium]|nr:hypothetical protein [Rhodospirillaceae bacterium]